MVDARTGARFPAVAGGQPHYESFYAKAAHPDGGKAVWLRHTVHQRPGQPRTASLWLTLFDNAAGAPVALKHTVGAEALSAPAGAYVQVADATLSPGRAVGKMSVEGVSAFWDLTFTAGDPELRHLPADLLYRAPLPKTKSFTPHPHCRWSGTVRLGEREFALDAWPGMLGHNWGREHAERWVWLHGDPFTSEAGPDETAWLDIAFGRIKVAGWTTPWIGNGMLVVDGVRHRLGGIPAVRATKVAERPTSLEFTIPGKGIEVRGRVSEPDGGQVAWRYADPEGGEHHTVNCSAATLELEVRRGGGGPVKLVCEGAAAYELGMRETDHGIPVQPFPDGE